jgi:Cu-processing system permease protein
MKHVRLIGSLAYTSCIRDRLLHVIFGVAAVIFLLVPTCSLFSMRQVQELSVNVSLSAISAVLLLIAALLGASSVWREIEKRYVLSVLGLPVSRCDFVLGKFCGIATFIVSCGMVLGIAAAVAIAVASAQYPSDLPLRWSNIFLAISSDVLKSILLAAIALLVSCLSTSFYLPFFVTIAVYLAGSASQEVYEYLLGDYGKTIPPLVKILIKSVYYIIPNFSAFDFKVYAIYSMAPDARGIGFTLGYFILYSSGVLVMAVYAFNRREIL